jgi:hypothetical protein
MKTKSVLFSVILVLSLVSISAASEIDPETGLKYTQCGSVKTVESTQDYHELWKADGCNYGKIGSRVYRLDEKGHRLGGGYHRIEKLTLDQMRILGYCIKSNCGFDARYDQKWYGVLGAKVYVLDVEGERIRTLNAAEMEWAKIYVIARP